MQKILIYRDMKEPVVRYDGREIILPSKLQNKVDDYWKLQIQKG
jgi:hypothetical protein